MQVPLHRLYLGTQLVVDCRMFSQNINVLSKGIIRWMSNGTGLSLLDIPPSRWWKQGQGTLTTYYVFFHFMFLQSIHTKYFSAELVITFLSDLCEQQVQTVFFLVAILNCDLAIFAKCTCPSCHRQDPKICDLYIVDKCFLVRTPNQLFVSANEK